MKKQKRCELYCPACRSYIDNQNQDTQAMMKDTNILCMVDQDILSKELCVFFRLKPETEGREVL